MRIDGQIAAQKIQEKLKDDITNLSKRGIIPHIAIVTVGDEGSWKVYVTRKAALAKSLGIQTSIIDMSGKTEHEVSKIVTNLNEDNSIHGIIIQRPIPPHFSEQNTVALVTPQKDIDAFRNDTPFESPVFQGVRTTLESIYRTDLKTALSNKRVVVIGKGTTAGGPTIRGLQRAAINPTVIDSKTQDRTHSLRHADIIISAVGKEVLHASELKKGVVVIGIGARVEEGTLKGDFDEKSVEKIAAFYSPTPGGIGPLNVSYLFSNLIQATKEQTS